MQENRGLRHGVQENGGLRQYAHQGFKNLILTMSTFNSTSIRGVFLLDTRFGLANALPTEGIYAQRDFRLTVPRRLRR